MTIRMLLLLLPAAALFCQLLSSPVAAKESHLPSTTESSVNGGKTESSVTGGKIESSVTGGKTEYSVIGGKTESSVTGGKTESSVTGGKTESSVTGGKTESSVTGGKTDAVAPDNLQCQENSSKGNPEDIYGYLSCSQGEWIQKKCHKGLQWINYLNKCSWPPSTKPAKSRKTVTVPQPAATTTKDPSETCQMKSCPSNTACTEGRGQQPASCNCRTGYRKHRNQCIETCQVKSCASNAACAEGKRQQAATCNCKNGSRKHENQCIETCQMKSCPSNAACTEGRRQQAASCNCQNSFRKYGDQCIETCQMKSCPSNAACTEGRGQQAASCNCKTGFKKDGDQCIETCQMKSCPANAACTEGREQQAASCDCKNGFRKYGDQCIETCQMKSCLSNAVCTEGRKQQAASCNCKTGYRKNGDQCIETCQMKNCSSNAACNEGRGQEAASCNCKNGFRKHGDQCIETCQMKSCPSNAACTEGREQQTASCNCKNGLRKHGDQCIECNLDSHCGENKLCQSESCIDPCKSLQCGQGASCQVAQRQGQCVCPNNTQGDPHVQCQPISECTDNSECGESKRCHSGSCVDPCNLIQCGVGAICRMLESNPQCICPDNTDGNPFIECHSKQDCRTHPAEVQGTCIPLNDCPRLKAILGKTRSAGQADAIQILRNSICSTIPIKVCCETVATKPHGPSQDIASTNVSSSCQFPFIYKSMSYSACTSVDDPDGKLWCSTKKDNQNNHLKDEWKHCISDDTTVTRSGTVQDTLFPGDEIVISEEVTSDNTVAQKPDKNSNTNMNFPNKATRQPGCLELPDPGECRGAFPRYYYNQGRDQCDCFLFGGCDEEGVKFSWLTFEECRGTCVPGNHTKGPGCKGLSLEEVQRF